MPLLDLRTNLKSLRYGKDRVGGGSSNQPYIQRDLPDSLSEVGRTGGPDFLLRGGTLVPARVGRDVSRLTKMFFDFKSPNGVLFAAKQNVLALSSTNFKAGKPREISVGGTRVGDFLRNNIDLPLSNVYTPLNTIAQVAGGPIGLHLNKQGLNPLIGPDKYSDYIKGLDSDKTRLAGLRRSKLLGSESTFPTLYSYTGGPGSTLGVGKTTLRRYEFTDYTGPLPLPDYSELESFKNEKEFFGNQIVDFRQSFFGSNQKSLDYRTKNIEQRVNLGNPASKIRDKGEALDKINALAMYKADNVKNIHEKNDLVKFRIGIFDNDNPSKKVYLHFRAFIDSYSDSYDAEWNGERYLGRGEQFYRYNGFNRTINLGWTVAAQSRPELIPQYQKLNYLASSLAPDYSKESGYMRGNLAELTVGGWLFNQPGIIRSMTLDVPSESPWEIGISAQEGENTLNSGQELVKSFKGVKELPHIVKVTNFTFIPIHTFVPQIQQNNFDDENGSYLSKFGKERYIALDSGDSSNNYDYANYIGKNQY